LSKGPEFALNFVDYENVGVEVDLLAPLAFPLSLYGDYAVQT